MNTKIITLLFLAFSIIACETEKKISIEDSEFDNYFNDSNNIPVVKGQILNLSKDELKNTQVEYTIVTPFEYDRFHISKFSPLHEDGTFELEVDYPFPYQEIWIRIGKFFYAGIYAKSDLFIELDADILRKQRRFRNGSGIKYSGADGNLNNLLNNHALYKHTIQLGIETAIHNLDSRKNIAYNTYLTQLDSLYSLLHHIDNEFIEKNPSPYSYLIENDRMSGYYKNLCFMHGATGTFKDVKMSDELRKSILTHKAFLISNQSSSFYYQLFVFLQSEVYDYDKPFRGGYIGMINNVVNFIDYNKLSASEKDDMNQLLACKKQLENKQTIDNIKWTEIYNSFFDLAQDSIKRFVASETIDYLDSIFISSKADLLKLKMSSRDANENDMIYKTVLRSMKTQWCEQIISEEYKKNTERLSQLEDLLKKEQKTSIHEPFEQLTSGAKLYKIDNISAEDLLSELTTKFKGKALVIDFWATWCSPCIQEMHYSKELHDKLNDQPVEFVYLCTSNGSDLALWKTKIADLELNGTHLFVESTIQNKLMNVFSLSGFPSYAFINTMGVYKPEAIKRISYLNKEELIKLINE